MHAQVILLSSACVKLISALIVEVFSRAILCCGACTHLRLAWTIYPVMTLAGIHLEGLSVALYLALWFFPFISMHIAFVGK